MKKTPPKNGVIEEKKKVLLVDGNALLKFGYHGAKNEYNHRGEHIGGLYQFLTILRKLLDASSYHNVFVFWDGPLSGKLRYEIYKDYKSNRDKNFETGTYSQDKDIIRQKKLIWNYLEQLSIRQLEDFVVESDDMIAYFVKSYSDIYDITICTTDRDMAQLISENVSIYFCDIKNVVTHENYREYFSHHHKNSLLIKILAGDNSDCIKGIKEIKEPTLLKIIPDIANREVTLLEVINECRRIQQERVQNKKKPLIALDNILNKVTDGCQGDKIFEINNKIMNLKYPLMTDSALEKFNDLTTLPINPEGRSIKNVYDKMRKNGLDRLITEHQFVNYMLPFKRVINKEEEFYNNWIKENQD